MEVYVAYFIVRIVMKNIKEQVRDVFPVKLTQRGFYFFWRKTA